MGRVKRQKRNKHRGMRKRLINQKGPMSSENKKERKEKSEAQREKSKADNSKK